MRWMVLSSTVALVGAVSGCCAELPGEGEPGGPHGRRAEAPLCGIATLEACPMTDYEGCTLSIEHACVEGTERVRNDWDLQFGNDGREDLDLFTVNMVVDDRSFIVDLGPIALHEVPATVDLDGYPTGYWGEHDAIEVIRGHVYLVRTKDSDTCQYAAFRVVEHALERSVTVTWVRSVAHDRFAMFE